MFSLVQRAAIAAIAVTLALPTTGSAQSGAGAYLAGRQAAYDSDFAAAALYYARVLGMDPSNPKLMEDLAVAQLSSGQVLRALPVAQKIESDGLRSQVAHLIVVANLFADKQYDTVLARDLEKFGVGPLVDGLLIGWAHMGAGSVAKALAQFDIVADQNGLRGFAMYHKALALASVGDYEGAEALFAADDGALTTISRRAVLARVEILSQLDQNDKAREIMTDVFVGRSDPALISVTDRLTAGEKLPFTQVRSVQDGAAEVFFSIGAALNNEAADDYTLLYARAANFLRPDHIDSLLLSAELLDNLGQYELAVASYRQVPRDSLDHHAAELGRAEALRRAAKPDAAVEVLQQLSLEYPSMASVHSALGDLLRQQEEYQDAVNAYDKALSLTEEGAPAQWFLHYARGISHERLKNWDKSEADLRQALELNPEQPQVLNYLGYSMVEKQVNLDEALEMIERAVAARPESGYIVDSLGWVLFRLGRYSEAVAHMEKAVELMPVDPVVNDHLGDVYWAVGRIREAEFQWSRALSFVKPEDTDGEADPERIRRKLDVGLDAVLADEGADPLKVANDG